MRRKLHTKLPAASRRRVIGYDLATGKLKKMRSRKLIVCVCSVILSCNSLLGDDLQVPTGARALLALEMDALDPTISPCDDFYEYACRPFLSANAIPPGETSWSPTDILTHSNQEKLHHILEAVTANPTPDTKKLADYYATCMDEASIESAGDAPLSVALRLIEQLGTKTNIFQVVAELHALGVPVFFSFSWEYAEPKKKRGVAELDQAGLGLPDRDYYLQQDQRSMDLRRAYLGHITRMFELSGAGYPDGTRQAAGALRVEAALAAAAMAADKHADPATEQELAQEQLEKTMPSFNWTGYLSAAGSPPIEIFVILAPQYMEALDGIIRESDIADLRSYLRWHVLHASAAMLPARYAVEDFNFMRHILRGEAAPKPRWQKCVELVDEQLGDALGRLYVEKYFTVERASRVQSLAAAMKQGMMTEIAALAWPTVETKQQALQKVEAFAINIGYPKRWADYSGFKVLRGDALGNYQRGKVLRHELEWDMTVPSANAYYDLEQNALFLPAGILQAPLFDPSFDEAVNYGATATMVGHEMTHAFDDEGRKYDKNGDLHDWWSARDVQKYDRYAQCLVDQYSDYAVAGGGKLNGRLTLGENMADLAGTRLAFRVFEATAAASGSATPYRMTPEQRFFLAFAKSYCTKETPETTLLRIRSDPHSIEKYRVNGALSNVPEFRDAFACPKGAPMVRENICRPH